MWGFVQSLNEKDEFTEKINLTWKADIDMMQEFDACQPHFQTGMDEMIQTRRRLHMEKNLFHHILIIYNINNNNDDYDGLLFIATCLNLNRNLKVRA